MLLSGELSVRKNGAMHTSEHNDIACEEALKRVFDYIDNHLEGMTKNEFEHHIELCRHCFDRVEFEKLLKFRLRALRHKESSGLLRKRVEDIITNF
jgi:hypothetical protein